MAIDRFGRSIHYLRISLTDHCNLRCVYCMPEDMAFRPVADLMQGDEVLRLFHLFVSLGFDKFRLSGGEPTAHTDIIDLVRRMSATPGVQEIAMTTNGILLEKLAQPLVDAGLSRCNISLDTLDPGKFSHVTRGGRLKDVWRGIHAAEEAGLLPIKLNVVVVRGHNDGRDVIDMAGLTIEHDWQVRYIEMMPLGRLSDFQQSLVVTELELRDTLQAHFGPLISLNDGRLVGEAHIYQIPGARGTLGFISSVTSPFCSVCTRARLTPDGKLRLCLLREKEIDLLTPLRHGASDSELTSMIREGLWQKPWGHGLTEGAVPEGRMMSEIGG